MTHIKQKIELIPASIAASKAAQEMALFKKPPLAGLEILPPGET